MIEIVSHCYSGNLPQFAVFLRAQLSSLIIHKPDVNVISTICCDLDDLLTTRVLLEFQFLFGWRLRTLILPRKKLFRRAIGRNLAALETEADLIWFADIDHCWGKGCLDSLYQQWQTRQKSDQPFPTMIWPQEILVQSNFAVADQFWQSHLNSKGLIEPDPKDFVPKRYTKAIGGVQIVNGDFARKHGYLNGQKKWQTPVSPDKPFPSFRDDVKYRSFCQANGGCLPINLPNLYRLRHSKITYR